MAASLVALGFISLLGQVVLLRELSVALYGSELIYMLALGVWLLGTAGGAVGALPRARSSAPASPAAGPDIAWLFWSASVALPAAVVWTRAARRLLGAVSGAYLPFPAQLFTVAFTLLPVAFLSGLLFQAAARRAVTAGRGLGAAYGLESAGALAGGAAATLILRLGLSNLAAAVVCALAAAAAALAAIPRAARAPRAGRRRAVLVWAGLLVAALPLAPRLDRATTAWSHPGLLAVRDSPYGRVTLTGWPGQLNVFTNDALAYETGGTAAEEFVTVAALLHSRPSRVLILGGGEAGLVSEALRHGPRSVDSVELDPILQRLLLRHLPAPARADLAAPGVTLRLGDPRRFVTEESAVWDLVLVGMPEPTSGQANRFYTREFFAACARRLAPGGVLAFRLPGAENYWTPLLTRRAASIERALRSALPHVLVVPGATTLLAASATPLATDPDTLAARWRARGLDSRLVTPAYLTWALTNDRVAQVADALAAARVPANSDSRPICYQTTLMLWLAKFYPVLSRLDPLAAIETGHRGTWPRALGLAALGLAWLLLRAPAWRRAVVVAAAGCFGMIAEGLLLLAYQTRRGALYQDLGLLLMLFMAGLAVGALTVDRFAAPRQRPARRRHGFILQAGLAALALLLAERLQSGAGPGLLETGLWLLATGALTGGVFAHVSRLAPDQARAAGPLYAADVLGGCLGSLAASLLLIPLGGLPSTAVLLAGLAIATAFWL